MVGDRAIKHVADLLSDNIRSSDYLFRYGGEEFLLVLVETRAAEAFPLLERLRKKIGQLAFNVGGDTQIPITASIGFAAHTGHPDYNLLLRDADNALYAAKRDGRNCVKMHKGGDKTAAPVSVARPGKGSETQNSTGSPSPRFTSCSVCCVSWWARSLP